MSNFEGNVLELVNILYAVRCPLLIRSDDWWIEELLFKPGKPRTDLLYWILSQSVNGSFSSTYQDLDSTNVSSVSSNSSRKIPENDEGKPPFKISQIFIHSKLKFMFNRNP